MKSSAAQFKVGDHVYGSTEFSEYAVLGEAALKGMRLVLAVEISILVSRR